MIVKKKIKVNLKVKKVQRLKLMKKLWNLLFLHHLIN